MIVNSESKSIHLGDPTRWVDRFGDPLLRYALNRVGRREVAEDLVQETFLAAWRARKSYDGRSSFGTWLYSILRRKIADHFRSVGRQSLANEELAHNSAKYFDAHGKWLEVVAPWRESPDERAQNSELWSVFAFCLAALPAHLAEAFQLRELRQSSIEEVCAATGVTPKNLSVRLHRARLSLRRCLDQRWFRDGA